MTSAQSKVHKEIPEFSVEELDWPAQSTTIRYIKNKKSNSNKIECIIIITFLLDTVYAHNVTLIIFLLLKDWDADCKPVLISLH